MSEETSNLQIILLDILRGYSVFETKNKKLYFKHFLVSENLALEEFESFALMQAKKDGIKSEADLINEAIEKRYWSKSLEEKIKSLNWTIGKSEQAASKITDNIQKAAFSASIKNQKDELDELQSKRDRIILYSAENCANHKKNAKLIENSIFYDKEFKKRASKEDAYDIMSQLNSKLIELSKEVNLINAAYLNSFFELYSLTYRDPLSLIKRDIFTITVLQKNLLSYASIILNKLKNVDIPDDIRKDPIKIIKYNPSDNKSVKKTEGVDDLREKMARNNGQLKAEDLLS